ncbi:tetratricopeptide repeat protein [uncultured Sunxiuqinia sp.]|uniref:tetratricopeptide repeat protein n=1 Tax=uncultured Sunxiuqinia sp. TaxID=1573825 RepID=UPI002619DC0E|nr:tetratricopeptide repeat protein [uncultured Sunxiuqinia sp.]
MKVKVIKYGLILSCFLMLLVPESSLGQQLKMDINKLQLANQYYRNQEFDKSAVLYFEIYEVSGGEHYFNMFLNCLLELKDYPQAEKAIKTQLKNRKNDPSLWVQWGYLLSLQSQAKEAEQKFKQALELVSNNKGDYIRLANAFLSRQEYEYAQQVYLLGRERLPEESFHFELARIFLYQRNYGRMFQEYLDLLKMDESNLGRIQSSLLTAFRMDVDNSLRNEFRVALLRQIQQEPKITSYNHLLIWLFIQEKKFPQALRQSIALDKRIGSGDAQIASLARIAAGNDGIEEAIKAYDYLIEKGSSGEFYTKAHQGKMKMQYQQFVSRTNQFHDASELATQFETTFKIIGFHPENTSLVIDYAHFLAFYQQNTEQALSLIENQMGINGISPLQRDQLKNEMADIYVLKDDLWEAVLLYSQIIDANKNNPLGDEVKLKKAKLGYYMGNLSWAQAQLDVLKASTSKLIANDALELSVFISNNTALDTTEAPMQLFSRADLYQFRKQDSLAWAVLDSIEAQYNYHSLLDDLYFRKASMLMERGDFEQAAGLLEQITTEFAYDLLGDDAMFLLAELYEEHLNRASDAAALYKQMLVQYPGSIYLEDARERYRRLRGDVSVSKETLLMEGQELN